MSSISVQGRRILVLGPSLASLEAGPLAGARVEVTGVGQLAELAAQPCDLVMIDADAWGPGELGAAVQALATLQASPPVLLIGAHLPAGLVRNLIRLGRSDVLEAPFDDAQLLAAVAALLAESAPAAHAQASPRDTRCWAITGAVGGAGATTIAIEIATVLGARTKKDKSVCLVDLNLADGAAAAYLGAQPTTRLAEFGQAHERIDQALLQAFVTPVSKHVDLIAGVRDAAAFDAVPREAVLRMLEVASETYDWVILDLPRHRRPWTLDALAGCDEIIVISELTVPALLAARAYSDEMEQALGSGLKPRIVLNRLATRMFGPAPSMGEAEKALQRKAEAGISSDWEAAAASANLGGPVAQHRPKSKIVKDVESLVERLAVHPRRDLTGTKAA
jgi:pilus assembly protein CpaE